MQQPPPAEQPDATPAAQASPPIETASPTESASAAATTGNPLPSDASSFDDDSGLPDVDEDITFDSEKPPEPTVEDDPAPAVLPPRATNRQPAVDRPDRRAKWLAALRQRLARVDRRIAVAVGAFAATFLTLAAATVAARGPIIAAVPRAEAIYAAVGLGPDTLGRGLEIGQVASTRENRGGEDILAVAGMVSNVAGTPARLPRIRVSLYDADDQEVHAVTLPQQQDMLAAGESLTFATTINAPPASARRIRVGFAAEDS